MSEEHFDPAWYAYRYPDVNGSGLGPREHFELVGKMLGRRGAPDDKPSAAAQPADVPKVSVICITYNQAPFIEQTLRGFLSQRVDFPVEFLIADDGSADGTRDIIRRYAAEDSRIVPILREKNLGAIPNFFDTAKRTRGEYVAMCEGDDYWTDPDKLTLQARFLDNHPYHSVCFHYARVQWEGVDRPSTIVPAHMSEHTSLRDLILDNYIQTNSVMYRSRFAHDLPADYDFTIFPTDYSLHLMHAELGRIGFIDRVMSVYRRHPGGIWSTSSDIVHHRRFMESLLAFFRYEAGQFGGFFRPHMQRLAATMFRYYAEFILQDDQIEEMLRIVKLDKTVADLALRSMGFDPATVQRSNSDDLRKSLGKQHKVSIVVLTHNHERTIERCLKGISEQRGYFDLEIILADYGSNDNTVTLAQKLIAAPRARTIRLDVVHSTGKAKALQSALDRCSGGYIAICEGDENWISDRKLAKQVRQLAGEPKSAMTFSWLLNEEPEARNITPHPAHATIPAGLISFSQLAKERLADSFAGCLYRATILKGAPNSFYAEASLSPWLFNLYVANTGRVYFAKEMFVSRMRAGINAWTRIAEYRDSSETEVDVKRALEMFGRARGLDESALWFGVYDLGNDADVMAYLETPADQSHAFVERDSIRFVGWAAHKLAKGIEIVVRSGDFEQRYPLTIFRDDVTNHLRNLGRFFVPGREYGFDFEVPYDERRKSYDLGFSVGDEIAWWKRVDVELAKS